VRAEGGEFDEQGFVRDGGRWFAEFET
jgi:hypothetical protein